MNIALTFILPILSSGQNTKLLLEDIWSKPTFIAKPVNSLRSLNDGLRFSNVVQSNTGQSIVLYDFASGNSSDTLIRPSELKAEDKSFTFSDYTLSSTESKILFSTDVEQIYRHSTKASYFVYDRQAKKLTPLSNNGKQMYASFSPDESKVAFVRDNNLYIKDLLNNTEIEVTKDGKKNEVINGATDWVYEEEFSMDIAFAWNKTGTAIAFYKFDESRVKEFNLTYYEDLYPKEEKYKYPMPGEENSKVDIYVYHVLNNKTVKMNTGIEREYIPRIKWTTDPEVLSIQLLNRHQNNLELLLCNTTSGAGKKILKEENNSYINITNDLYFLKNGKEFIWSSARNGYSHIYLYSLNGALISQVTKGNFDVTSFYGYEEESHRFYYQSAEPTPTERRISCITLNQKPKLLSPASGTNKAEFSTSFHYFLNNHSAYGEPYRCSIINNQGKEMRLLEENKKVKEALAKYTLSPVETLQVDNGAGYKLNGWMIKPSDFDPQKKYPLLVFVYGGPGETTQTVMNQWGSGNYLWHQFLAQHGYIIASFDNRGTVGRGFEFSSSTYKNLGKYEVMDQLAMVNFLKTQSFIDSTRVGVWGWSFGGYLTSLLMTKGNGVFKAGIAVAPVTNWRFYDSIYTERYLQTPQENPTGYDENSPLTYAKNLTGNFLLVHGAYDDNVHLQNTMEFVDELVKENKQFDLFIYPNKNHSIRGGNTRLHLYTKMTNFILNNL